MSDHKHFGRFGIDGVRFDTVDANYMIQDGFMVKLYRNQEGGATEDELVAVIDTATGLAVINTAAKV